MLTAEGIRTFRAAVHASHELRVAQLMIDADSFQTLVNLLMKSYDDVIGIWLERHRGSDSFVDESVRLYQAIQRCVDMKVGYKEMEVGR